MTRDERTVPNSETRTVRRGRARGLRPTDSRAAADGSRPPPEVTRAISALLDMHLAAELADYLGSDPERRGDHVLCHWVALARYAAPAHLDSLGVPDDDRGEVRDGHQR